MFLGSSLVSVMAAISILLVYKKHSSSRFFGVTEFAFHAFIRRLRMIGRGDTGNDCLHYSNEFGYRVLRFYRDTIPRSSSRYKY
jgi:hypothetical protein